MKIIFIEMYSLLNNKLQNMFKKYALMFQSNSLFNYGLF